jgi:hypothetical protein
MLASVTQREAEFTTLERDLQLAALRAKALRGRHGVPMDEATDPENRGKFKAAAMTDFAQAELDRIEAEYREKYAHDKGHGRFFIVSKTD